CVVITAFASIDTAVESIKRGATDYLAKPFTPGQVAVVTKKVAELRELQRRVDELQSATGEARNGEAGGDVDLESAAPAMQRAVALARQVAETDSTVLIRGESGTGKGVLARAIHAWSPRGRGASPGAAGKPFNIVSCPSLSRELLESELFGHVRGA